LKFRTHNIGLILFSGYTHAAPEWTGGYTEGAPGHTVSVIDSLNIGSSSYITLNGFQNSKCTARANRINLTSSNQSHYQSLLSMVLSAYHSGSKVSFLIDDSCNSDRIVLIK